MMVYCPGQDCYFQNENENDDVFPSVCSHQCNDAANRRLMESHAEDVYILTLPLGLDLQITPSLVNSIQNEVNNFHHHQPTNLGPSSPLKYNELVDHEKLRASCLSASTIKIGSWERKSANVSDLVMKIYFAKRRVVWELLQDNRRKKNKIEIRWNDIIGIRVTIEKDDARVLQVELACPPSFMEEMEPEPRKHTIWLTSNDFTGGQASICRRHLVTFHPGTLPKHIQKLFLVEPRLCELSMKAFPTKESPHFERRPTLFPFLDFNGVFQPLGGFPYYPINNFPMAAVHPSLHQLPSPISDQHFLHDGRVYVNPTFVQESRSNADGLSGGQVHGIVSNVAPSTLVSPALYHRPLGEQHGLQAWGGNYDPRKIKPINNQLQNDIKNVSWTVKQSSQSIDSWNAMLKGSRDGTHHGIRNPLHHEHGSNSTVDNNAGSNENVPITTDSQVYQIASGMPPSLSHVHGIKDPPHYEHDSSSTVEDYATLNENVPVPDFQFYQTASGMPPSLSQVQPAMMHQNWGNLAYDPNAIALTGYNSFGSHEAHLFRERKKNRKEDDDDVCI